MFLFTLTVSTQVVEEYQDVQCKLDIEKSCREEAEKFATKVGIRKKQ